MFLLSQITVEKYILKVSFFQDFQVILKGFHMAASGLANKDNPILGQVRVPVVSGQLLE